MNLVLFDPNELAAPLPRTDRRAVHVLQVLRRQVGDAFDAGLVNGPRGKATVTDITADHLALTFVATTPPPVAPPITLLVGLPRPQTARDVLRDATTVGVGAIHFVRTEKGESSYAQSSLWSSGEWRRHVLAGAEQAFVTQVPEVTHGRTIAEVLKETCPAPAAGVSAGAAVRLTLDNYEAARPLAAAAPRRGSPVVLAIGSERGWSAAERVLLRDHGFTFVHLGERVLRTETAVIAALSLLLLH
ncbi:RsmE family RNA methyltransferase [Opitutus sp. ER46]|uniref:16S rRNA (uracil(1498)-N(3))-methyltransferase n=1 Tax=Opitutus sp. ER46 TaxID=2161864 RepID=UPI001E5C0E0A|nr:RsmE family RNA methyltransferase [Opitutus sp. ER46]